MNPRTLAITLGLCAIGALGYTAGLNLLGAAILVGLVAALGAYLWYGFARVAPAYVARETANDVAKYPSLYGTPEKIADKRRFHAGMAVMPALFWPVHLAGRALVGSIASAAPLTDHELREQNKQQAERIAELERELGIGDSA